MHANAEEKLDPVDLAFENAPRVGPDDMSAEELARLEDAIRESHSTEAQDACILAFENAKPLDEPLSDEEMAAIDAAMSTPTGNGSTTAEIFTVLARRARLEE